MQNFWQKLAKNKKLITILAPMSGVMDFPFREIIAEIGKPSVFFTEFISTEGIVRNSVGITLNMFLQYKQQMHFSRKQRPIIVQFFGCKPEQFEYCARIAVKLGFEGIDINMGCPDRKVQKQGAGSELIKNPQLVKEIIRAVKKGCDDKIPISIKTRLGWKRKDILGYLKILRDIVAEGDISAITIHGRTVTQGYSGQADWDEIGKFAKELKSVKPDLVVIGNGDVKNLDQAKILAKKYGVDGVMIGRQILHNPWVFDKHESLQIEKQITTNNIKKRIKIALKHTRLFEKFYGKEKSFSLMKKYYKTYFLGVSGEMFPKKELMECKSIREAKKILKQRY